MIDQFALLLSNLFLTLYRNLTTYLQKSSANVQIDIFSLSLYCTLFCILQPLSPIASTLAIGVRIHKFTRNSSVKIGQYSTNVSKRVHGQVQKCEIFVKIAIFVGQVEVLGVSGICCLLRCTRFVSVWYFWLFLDSFYIF